MALFGEPLAQSVLRNDGYKIVGRWNPMMVIKFLADVNMEKPVVFSWFNLVD
jgi:hypothetical protein